MAGQAQCATHRIRGRVVTGFVSIVGAGPGAADLLTLRALDRIQKADVVLHDRLIDEGVLDLIPATAEKIYVGKAAGNHFMPQAQIHEVLIQQAQSGKRVVRLKGGDPFIFGRGGEEMQALQAAGIAYEIVPGVTAAQGCAASAHIPLTHRDFASSCAFLPGHLADEENNTLNWQTLAQSGQTLVFYMATKRIDVIAQALIAHGMAGNTPAALVQNGTRADEKRWVQPLERWAQQTPNYTAKPGLLIVGKVVRCMSTHKLPNER